MTHQQLAELAAMTLDPILHAAIKQLIEECETNAVRAEQERASTLINFVFESADCATSALNQELVKLFREYQKGVV